VIRISNKKTHCSDWYSFENTTRIWLFKTKSFWIKGNDI